MEDRDEQLRRLADELAGAASAGSDEAGETLGHVQRHLESNEEEQEDLVDRLSDAVLQLETSHPDLAATIQAVIHSLTGSGI